MNYQIEITRKNVTLAQFLAYCRHECKKKGIGFYIDREEFENPPQTMNNRYFVKDGKKICYNDGYKSEWDANETSCQSEIITIAPLEYQTYVLNYDGSCYNEICEFTYWDEKTGNGYYYQINKDS